MKNGIALILLLLMPITARAWTTADTAREITWEIIHFMDYGQTLEIARNPREHSELNPILGKHPSVGNVNLYMLSGAILHPIVSYILPDKVRPYFQYITIGMSTACVVHNFNAGLQVRF